MPRHDREWLTNILEAVGNVETFVTGVTFAEFVTDVMRRSATLQQLSVVGEAASHLTPELRQLHPEIDWRSMIGFRNIAVHGYFGIVWEIVWATATTNVPSLALQIAAILDQEFPATEPTEPEPEE